ncbi:MAG: glycosyltransferase family 1 protein [Candidatus Microgenomates bacterium]
MARIAIDARFYGTEHTGLGRYTTNVLSHLPAYLKNHQLFVILRKKYYDSLVLPANCTKVLFDTPHYTFAEQLLLPIKLISLKPDLLYTLHFNTPILSAVPSIVTIHDLIKTYFSGSEISTRSPLVFKLKRAGYHCVISHTLTRAQEIIVPTNTVKNQILANFPTVKPERIHPIPEAPDPIFTQKVAANTGSLLSDLPAKYLLYVGNAYPHKNLKVLLDAFRDLKDPLLHLVIVSKITPFLSRTLAPYEPKNIHLLSELTDNDLIIVYKNAKALVTPSLMEGYGLPGLEAMILGVPVIASNIPVYREVYQDLVTYFDSKNASDLARVIKTVLNTPRPSPLKITHTWKTVAESIAEVLNASCTRLRSSK